jgi:hypothetical protein
VGEVTLRRSETISVQGGVFALRRVLRRLRRREVLGEAAAFRRVISTGVAEARRRAFRIAQRRLLVHDNKTWSRETSPRAFKKRVGRGKRLLVPLKENEVGCEGAGCEITYARGSADHNTMTTRCRLGGRQARVNYARGTDTSVMRKPPRAAAREK